MTGDGWLTLAVALATVTLLVFEKVRASAALLGATTVLLVTGVLTTEQAFAGFSNPAPLTVAALFVVARAIEKTGILQLLTVRALGEGRHQRWSLARLTGPVVGLSAFVNNTPIVALMAPQISDWASRRGVSPSRFLMPLSYAAILGGVITTIGTSTNLVVSGLLQQDGQAPLALFEMTPVGLPVALAGAVLLVWLAPILLPERQAARRDFEQGVPEFVVAMRVVCGGPLDGKTVEQAELRHLQGVFLFQIDRGKESIAPVTPATTLRGGDLLSFAGRVDTIMDLQHMPGLVSEEAKHFTSARSAHSFYEVVVGVQSPLVGLTLRDAQFRGRYQAAVLAVHRAGARVRAKLGDVQIATGDTLLILADRDFLERWLHRRDFLLIARLDRQPRVATGHLWTVAAITAGMVLAATLGYASILEVALAGSFAFVLSRVLTLTEASEAIDLDVIVMIAASFGLGNAMSSTGVALWLAQGLTTLFAFAGAVGPVLAIVLATALLTEIITNNAAAALIYPVAAATAHTAGLDPRSMAIAVAVMASASFLTPLGYQTNIMVYGPGGYRFADFTRLGAPLTIASIVITTWMTM